MLSNVPNLIRFYRSQSRPVLTQAALAGLLGASVNTVGSWEKQGVPDEKSLLQLVKVFVANGAIQDYETAQKFWETSSRMPFVEPPALQKLFIAQTPLVPQQLPIPDSISTSPPISNVSPITTSPSVTTSVSTKPNGRWRGYLLVAVLMVVIVGIIAEQRFLSPFQRVTAFTDRSEQCSDRMVQRLETLNYPSKWWSDDANPLAVVGRPGFEDLRYFEQGSSQPPRPGDVLVWPGDSNQHRMVIDRMSGNWLQGIEQAQGSGSATQCAELGLQRSADGQFTVSDAQGIAPMGWIHSIQMEFALSPQRKPRNVEGSFTQLRWSQDADSIYIFISQEYTRRLAQGALDLENSLGGAMLATDSHGILGQTTIAYSECVARKVTRLIQEDSRFSPAHGVSSVDYTLKYAGDHIWVRPHNGSHHQQWVKVGGVQCGPDSK